MTVRNSIVVAAVAAALAGPCLAETPPLSFKGIELGKSVPADVTTKFPGAQTLSSSIVATPDNYAKAQCGAFTIASSNCHIEAMKGALFRIGQTSTGEFYFSVMDNVVEGVRATFSTSSFDAIAGALEEKYGTPSSRSREQIQSKAGAIFESRVVTWRLSDGNIRVEERSGKIDSMAVSMTSNKLSAQREAAAKKSIKDAAAKDL